MSVAVWVWECVCKCLWLSVSVCVCLFMGFDMGWHGLVVGCQESRESLDGTIGT